MKADVLLRCAQKIEPLEAFGVHYKPVIENGMVLLKDQRPITVEQYGSLAPLLEFPSLSFELTNKVWQMDLQIALEREGWNFYYDKEKNLFMADDPSFEYFVSCPTKPGLLYAIVAGDE